LLNTREVCVTEGGCSGCGTGTGSLGLVCGAGDCSTGGFSSTTSGAGVACASSDAFVRLLRCTGCAFGSLGSVGLRGFLAFFSGSGRIASFPLGFGPGFLRGCPDAVRPRSAGDVACAGVGVLAPPTPTPDTRMVEFGVPCSGECGGELKLPGEESLASMAEKTESTQPRNTVDRRNLLLYATVRLKNAARTSNVPRVQVARELGYAPIAGCAGCKLNTKSCE
jgi:hypothetical protein